MGARPGESEIIGSVLERQLRRDVALAREAEGRGDHDRAVELYKQSVSRILIRMLNTRKRGEAR